MRGLRSIKRSLAPVQACRASFGNCCLVQMQCTGLLLIATRRKLMQSASLADAAASPGNSLDQSLHNSHAGLHLQHNAPAGGLNACQNGLLLQHGQRARPSKPVAESAPLLSISCSARHQHPSRCIPVVATQRRNQKSPVHQSCGSPLLAFLQLEKFKKFCCERALPQ